MYFLKYIFDIDEKHRST